MTYSYAWGDIFSPGKAVDFFLTGNPQPFEPHEAVFSRANGWWLSELSRLIYVRNDDESDGGKNVDSRDQTAIRNRYLHQKGLAERWFYNGRHLQCAIISTLPEHGQHYSVLVFRGTRGNLANWLYNLSTALSAWPTGGNVHSGFKMILMGAWEAIVKQLETIDGPLYYTGHSMGGALAVLAASLKNPQAVYTFGSPRVGNDDFVNATKHIKIYRVVNPRDIVAVCPPIPGVLHVGEPHCLPSPKATDVPRSWFDAPGFLADHSPTNYTVQL